MLGFETQSEQFKYLVEVSPLATAVFTGPNLVVAAVNEQMLKIWGKGDDILGTTILKVLPEIKNQPFIKLLKRVYTKGKSYSAEEIAAELLKDGELKTFYFNINYKALLDQNGNIVGVMNTALDVTEAVLARRLAANIKEQVAFALSSAKIGTWNFDVTSQQFSIDQASLVLIGKGDGETLTYEALQDFVDEADRKLVTAAMLRASVKEFGGEFNVNFRIRKKEANTVWIKCKGKAYFNDDDTVDRFAGVLLNITGELETQTDLKRLAAIVNSSEDFCSYTDMAGLVLYINPAGRKLVGLSEKSEIPKQKFAFHNEVSISKIENEVFAVLLANGRWSGELTLINQQTKEHIPIYEQLHLINEEATNKPLCIAGIAKDLSEELNVRKTLADKNKDLETIVSELKFLADTVPPVVWSSKPNGLLDFINQRWYDQTGRTELETLGFNWINAVHPADVAKASLLWKNSLQSGQLYEVEFRIITKDNKYRWFLVRALPLKDQYGKIIKWYGTNTDIQHQKELEKQKDDFLAIASHELKTPVTSLKAYTQVVEAMFVKTGDERNAKLLSRMNKQIDRLTKLIDDLLNVTKIAAGKLELNLAKFNFKNLIDEVTEEVQKTTTKHKIIKIQKFFGDITSDRDRIYQVIVNLLTNAIKYSPEDKKIELFVTPFENHVLISVKDTGIGIAENAKHKVFEQFYRIEGVSEQTFAGMGLGLFICSDIVKRLGGEIWVESVENKGSTFSFTIPFAK